MDAYELEPAEQRQKKRRILEEVSTLTDIGVENIRVDVDKYGRVNGVHADATEVDVVKRCLHNKRCAAISNRSCD